ALVFFFGVFALVDGVFAIATAVSRRRLEPHWAALLVGGILGVVIGVIALALPGMTPLVLLYLIAVWALVTGVSHIIVAIRLRRMLRTELPLISTGVLWTVLSVLLATLVAPGVLALLVWIGAFATVVGILLLGLAFRLRRRDREARGEEVRRVAASCRRLRCASRREPEKDRPRRCWRRGHARLARGIRRARARAARISTRAPRSAGERSVIEG